MSASTKPKTGAAVFIFFGLIHVIGGGMLLAALTDGLAPAIKPPAGRYAP